MLAKLCQFVHCLSQSSKGSENKAHNDFFVLFGGPGVGSSCCRGVAVVLP